MTAPARYPVRTRILHWLTAVLVFSALFIGFVMVNSLGSYASLRVVHMTLGVVVLAIVVVRAANRFTHRVPKLPDTVGWVEHKLVVGSELTLYAVMLAQPLVGWAMVSASRQAGCGLRVTGSATHCAVRCRPVFRPPPDSFAVGLRIGGRYCRACQRGAAAHVDASGRHAVTDDVRASTATTTSATDRVFGRHAAQLCEFAHARARCHAPCNT